MERLIQYFKKAGNKVGEIFDDNDPLIILPYRGYANAERVFLKGRVLENENIFQGKSDSEIRNLIDSFKRFETDEIPNAVVRISIDNRDYDVVTDDEGYFTLDVPWQSPLKAMENQWLRADLALVETPNEKFPAVTAKGQVLLPSTNADYGVITDVDDTILQTHVTSLFRLKMLYATFIQDAHQRLPMEGMVDLFNAFVKGGDGKRENPIFYVSHSPWNMYDLLEEFMRVQNFPAGPIMLRDFGIKKTEAFSNHKLNSIGHILSTYPDLPFIMLGDTAAKDADYYIELASQFPNRIKAIYIRQTRDTKNARRIAQLIEANSNINVILVNSSTEILLHARTLGLLSK